MPEGPEVTITSLFLTAKLKHSQINSISILSGRYKHLPFKGYTKATSKAPLKIMNVSSKGKLLFFELHGSDNSQIYLVNTLGLTGVWTFEESSSGRVVFKITDSHKHEVDLFYDDPRNFGTLEFMFDKKTLEKRLNKLAPDVLRANLTTDQTVALVKTFVNSTRKKDLNVVKVLMNDQEAVVSGIGNYLIAEILYDAKISPFRNFDDLSDDEIFVLAQSIRKIVKSAYANNSTGYMGELSDFLDELRVGIKKGKYPNYHPDIKAKKFDFHVYRKKTDKHGNNVKNDEIIKGRTIYWVPNVQH